MNLDQRLEEINEEIAKLRTESEQLKSTYALPYTKNFRKQYLWNDEQAEQKYLNNQVKIGTLLVEQFQIKRDLGVS